MNKVFVVQEVMRRDNISGEFKPVHNLSPAAAYGELVTILHPGPLPISPEPIIARMQEALKNYEKTDYILPTGDPVAIAVAAMIAVKKSGGYLNILKWDRTAKKYIPVSFFISQE